MDEAGIDFNVWEGVFESFADAPSAGLGFKGDEWRMRSEALARAMLADVDIHSLDFSTYQRNAVLCTLVPTLLRTNDVVSVLDFGGSVGYGYNILRTVLGPDISRIRYSIVEVAPICDLGRQLFAGNRNIRFSVDLLTEETFDVVFTASALQYIDDWHKLVGDLAAFGAQYLLFSDVFAGPFNAFATLQNYYGNQLPHWFLNVDAFMETVRSRGYHKILEAPCHTEILGKRGLPMSNFPTNLRLPFTRHFLFAKSSEERLKLKSEAVSPSPYDGEPSRDEAP
jgi:putative methyltransferase (TIGR04325 family)